MSTSTKDETHTAEDHWEIDRWRPNNWWCSGGLMQRNKPPPVCCKSLIFQRSSAIVIKSCNIKHCRGEANEKYRFSFISYSIIFLFFYIHFSRCESDRLFSSHTFYWLYADIHRYNHHRGFSRRMTTQLMKLIKYQNIIYSFGESHNIRRPTRQRHEIRHHLFLLLYDEHLIT